MESKKIIRRLAAVVAVVCLILTGQAYCQSWQHRQQINRLREMTAKTDTRRNVESASRTDSASQTNAAMQMYSAAQIYNAAQIYSASRTDGAPRTGSAPREICVLPDQAAEKPVMLAAYVDLYEENTDLAGWLSIEGTRIDYPVMQGDEDDEFYLHHDFYGEDSKYGCPYVRPRADLDAGTNFIIYGHYMSDGSMFKDLELYLRESFYKEHPTVSFDTLYEERTYEIVAVFRSRVYNANDDVFKYYQFYQADTQEEFDDFYDNIKALALYDTGVTAEFGDTFLTLSTCAYHVKDGRLVVVAKRVA